MNMKSGRPTRVTPDYVAKAKAKSREAAIDILENMEALTPTTHADRITVIRITHISFDGKEEEFVVDCTKE